MAVFIIVAAEETKYIARQKNIKIFLTTVNHSKLCRFVLPWFVVSVLYKLESLCLAPFVCLFVFCCPCNLFSFITRPINMLTEENHLWIFSFFFLIPSESGVKFSR